MTEIFPQIITVLPGDVQTFTLRSSPPPVLWDSIDFADLEADQSLTRNSAALFGGIIAPRVHSGIAGVQWTISADMLPDTGGELQMFLFGVGARIPTNGLQVFIAPTSIQVNDNDGNPLDTISHTIAAGDVFYLEVSGNIFRLAINGVTETTYEVTDPTEYPVRASIFLDPPADSATPKITTPVLTGIWDIIPTESAQDTLWTPLGGTVDDSTDVWQVQYTAGNQPGVYTLSCVVASQALQTFTATVIIPPLSVLGLTDVTLQPGEKYRFKTNYDDAASKIVTWSVYSGGGSFANGEYTAGTAPGTSVLLAKYGDQEVTVTVRVPAVMTITVSGVAVTAAKLGEVLTLTTNMGGTVNWTKDLGTLSATTGATVTWTAPNQSQLVALVTAENGTYTVTAEIWVLKHFPYDPNQTVNFERRKSVLISRAEDRSRSSRVKDYNNEAFEAFELSFRDRLLAEFEAARAFWDDHHPGKRLIYEDKIRSLRRVVWTDSDIRIEGYSRKAISYSFRVIEG